jgi:hypothetical protein
MTVRLNNATLRNETSGVLELQQGWIGINSGTPTLQNNGLIKKVSSNNATLYGLVITGTGRVQVQEGALYWSSCTLSNATVQVEQVQAVLEQLHAFQRDRAGGAGHALLVAAVWQATRRLLLGQAPWQSTGVCRWRRMRR